MQRKMIRWGILGAGDVCELKSGPAFNKVSNSRLVAIMRRTAEKAKSYAQRHHIEHWYSNAQALLADDQIDAVYIATPPGSHKELAIQAMQAGKHVYIEKPVTLNARECEDVIEAQQSNSVKATVAHYRRYVPSFMKMRSLLLEGEIGTPLLAKIDMLLPNQTPLVAKTDHNWRVNPAISGGGLFHDLSPHQLDLMFHWFGRTVYAHGFSLNQVTGGQVIGDPVDDCVLGLARFDSGVEFQGRWHFGVPSSQTRDICEIIGTKGSLSINFFGEQVITLKTQTSQQIFRLPNPKHIQQPMIEQVNQYFLDESDNPCSLEDALQTMQLMDAFTAN